MKTGRSYHMSQDIRGAIENWKKREWVNALTWITKSDGTRFASVEELKDAFWSEIAQGHEVIPYGDCDNFDWKKGCQGHPMREEAVA